MALGFGTSHTICVKVLCEVGDHIGFDVEGSGRETILYCLDSQRHFTQDPHLVATKEKFLTLQVRHLEAQTTHQVIVNQ